MKLAWHKSLHFLKTSNCILHFVYILKTIQPQHLTLLFLILLFFFIKHTAKFKDYGFQYLRHWVSGFDPGILTVHRTLPRSHIIEVLEAPIFTRYTSYHQNRYALSIFHNQQITKWSLRNKEYFFHLPLLVVSTVFHLSVQNPKSSNRVNSEIPSIASPTPRQEVDEKYIARRMKFIIFQQYRNKANVCLLHQDPLDTFGIHFPTAMWKNKIK